MTRLFQIKAILAVCLFASHSAAQDRNTITNPVIGTLYDAICSVPQSCQLEEVATSREGTRFAFAFDGTQTELPLSFRRIVVSYSAATSALFSLMPQQIEATISGLQLQDLQGSEAVAGFINLVLANNAKATLDLNLTDPGRIGWQGNARLSTGDSLSFQANIKVSDVARSMASDDDQDPQNQLGSFLISHVLSGLESVDLSVRETALFDLMHLPWQIQYGDRQDQIYAQAINFVTALPAAPADHTLPGKTQIQVSAKALAQARDNLAASISFLRDWNKSDHGLDIALRPGPEKPLAFVALSEVVPNLSFVSILSRLGERLNGGVGAHFLLNDADALDTDFLWAMILNEAAALQDAGAELTYARR